MPELEPPVRGQINRTLVGAEIFSADHNYNEYLAIMQVDISHIFSRARPRAYLSAVRGAFIPAKTLPMASIQKSLLYIT